MTEQRRLRDLRSIGPAMLEDFERLGIRSVDQLRSKDARKLYDRLCRISGQKQDICVLDVFECAIAQARNPNLPDEQRDWFYWSRRRKAKAR